MRLEPKAVLWLATGMADHRDTLLLPFERDLLSAGSRAVFLNADVLPSGDCFSDTHLVCEQGFKPSHNALLEAGYDTSPHLPEPLDQAADAALILAHRSRAINEINFERGWNMVRPGGTVVFCGAKKSGVQSQRKWVASWTEVEGSLSKNHAQVFWTRRGDMDRTIAARETTVGPYRIGPGMFSHQGPDKASEILVQAFDDRIYGRVADFGAGWGYLTCELLKRCERIEAVELYEADYASLEASKRHLAAHDNCQFFWCDLLSEAPRKPFDWVIMNPPFHQGRAADPAIGTTFIENAARTLPSGGRLLLVANINLPYERTLSDLFRSVRRLTERDGFKVLEAVR